MQGTSFGATWGTEILPYGLEDLGRVVFSDHKSGMFLQLFRRLVPVTFYAPNWHLFSYFVTQNTHLLGPGPQHDKPDFLELYANVANVSIAPNSHDFCNITF